MTDRVEFDIEGKPLVRRAPLAARHQRLVEAARAVVEWCDAYPVSAFREMTSEEWKVAREALLSVGLPIDRISASNFRHVLSGVRGKLAAVLAEEGK